MKVLLKHGLIAFLPASCSGMDVKFQPVFSDVRALSTVVKTTHVYYSREPLAHVAFEKTEMPKLSA